MGISQIKSQLAFPSAQLVFPRKHPSVFSVPLPVCQQSHRIVIRGREGERGNDTAEPFLRMMQKKQPHRLDH